MREEREENLLLDVKERIRDELSDDLSSSEPTSVETCDSKGGSIHVLEPDINFSLYSASLV